MSRSIWLCRTTLDLFIPLFAPRPFNWKLSPANVPCLFMIYWIQHWHSTLLPVSFFTPCTLHSSALRQSINKNYQHVYGRWTKRLLAFSLFRLTRFSLWRIHLALNGKKQKNEKSSHAPTLDYYLSFMLIDDCLRVVFVCEWFKAFRIAIP